MKFEVIISDGIFANNLRFLLFKNGMLQKELAKETGINHSTISTYCKGYLHKPYESTLKLIADYFEVTTDDLYNTQLWDESAEFPDEQPEAKESKAKPKQRKRRKTKAENLDSFAKKLKKKGISYSEYQMQETLKMTHIERRRKKHDGMPILWQLEIQSNQQQICRRKCFQNQALFRV